MDPSEELQAILDELRTPCDALIALHEQLAIALRDGDAQAVRRLCVQLETARYVCAALACGIAARLAGYYGVRSPRRGGN